MSYSIGIDLGNNYSLAAINMAGMPRILLNKENEEFTPSVVSCYKGLILVGALAFDRMIFVPKDTIISIKRLIGRAYSDPEVQNVKKNYHFEIVSPTDGTSEDLRVILGGKEYSPIEITSMILKKIKEDAETRLGDTVEYAVITVPAYFTDKQKEATREAAKLAGLKVQKLIDESTAAAIAYGVDNISSNEIRTILVYDLAGGACEVSVLMIAGGVFTQLDIEGDLWLGGENFDHMIMNYVIDCIKKEYDVEPRSNQRFMVELKKRAERARKILSSMSRTDIIILGLLQDNTGYLLDIEVELTREQFEKMIAYDINLSMHLVDTAIENAGLTPDQIDNILLVGESSSIPLVQKLLEEKFGKEKILQHVDPIRCVAFGANIIAAMRGEQIDCTKGHLNSGDKDPCSVCGEALYSYSEVIHDYFFPMHYGIQTKNDKFLIIFPKGSPYPSPEPVVSTFYTEYDNMRRAKIPVYAGLKEIASQNEFQVIFWIEIPENVAKDTPIEVSFQLDPDCMLEIVKAILKDGSERILKVYPDRGNEKRSQIEKRLCTISERIYDIKDHRDDENIKNIIMEYNAAINAANFYQLELADKIIKELEIELKLLDHYGEIN